MNTTLRLASSGGLRTAALAGALLACLVVATPSQAALVDIDTSNYHSSVFVQGSSLTLTDLYSSHPGTVTLKIADIGWPNLLQSLSVNLSVLGKTLLTEKSAGSLTFEISEDETLSLGIYATAGGTLKYGLYTLDTYFTPSITAVPVPAAGLLLASGLGLLPLLRRRRKNESTI